MKKYDVSMFPHEGEKTLGVVLKHYTNPLDDFFIIYAKHSLIEYHNEKECKVIMRNVVIPMCDDTLTEVKLRSQRVKNIIDSHGSIDSLIDAMQHMDIDELF